MSRIVAHLHVFAINPSNSCGWLKIGHRTFPCLLGKKGRTYFKREGDNKTPIGKWKLELLYFRPDKGLRPLSKLPTKPLRKNDGWCDAKGHKDYNRHVKLPFPSSHESLWRNDRAYDLIITTSHNQRPRVQGAGSAIFLHVWRQGATGTEGCVALKAADLHKVLAACSKATDLVI